MTPEEWQAISRQMRGAVAPIREAMEQVRRMQEEVYGPLREAAEQARRAREQLFAPVGEVMAKAVAAQASYDEMLLPLRASMAQAAAAVSPLREIAEQAAEAQKSRAAEISRLARPTLLELWNGVQAQPGFRLSDLVPVEVAYNGVAEALQAASVGGTEWVTAVIEDAAFAAAQGPKTIDYQRLGVILAAVAILISFLASVDDIVHNLGVGIGALLPVLSDFVQLTEALLRFLVDEAPHVIATE